MTTLIAPPSARKRLLALKRAGQIPSAPGRETPPAQWAKAKDRDVERRPVAPSKRELEELPEDPKPLALTVDEIAVVLEDAMLEMITGIQRAKARKVSMALAAMPRERQRVFPTAPTPERRQHGEPIASEVVIAGTGPVAPLMRHKVRSFLEKYGEHYDDAKLSALTRFYNDGEIATRVNITANYNPSGGGGGDKIGGLGNISQEHRLRAAEFHRLLDLLTPEQKKVLVVGLMEIRMGDSFKSITDVGRMIMPTFKDKATLRGIGLGYLACAAETINSFYRSERSLGRDPHKQARSVSHDPAH